MAPNGSYGTRPSNLGPNTNQGDTMKKTITAATVAAGLLLTGCSAPADEPATDTTAAAVPCIEEDYAGPVACYWDASTRGGGLGLSFTWTGTEVIYTSK